MTEEKTDKVKLFEKLDSIENRMKPLEEFINQFKKMIDIEKPESKKKEIEDPDSDWGWLW